MVAADGIWRESQFSENVDSSDNLNAGTPEGCERQTMIWWKGVRNVVGKHDF